MQTTPNIIKLLEQGVVNRQLLHDKEEVKRDGWFRAGSCGLYDTDSGVHTDVCMRKTLLRFLGYTMRHDLSSDRMMAGGVHSETWWQETLEASGFKGTIAREEEIGVELIDEKRNLKISGRPDMGLRDETGKLLLGLELKKASSFWALKNAITLDPKLVHVVQASFYSIAHGVPFELWYSSSDVHHVPESQEPYLAKGEAVFLKKWTESKFYAKKKTTSIGPLAIGFKIQVPPESLRTPGIPGFTSNESVFVQPLDPDGQNLGDPKESMVTPLRIMSYYVTAHKCVTEDRLPHKPKSCGAFDFWSGSKTPCDYCDLKEHCNGYEPKRKDLGEKGSLSAWIADGNRAGNLWVRVDGRTG